jgi:hypothetical protein
MEGEERANSSRGTLTLKNERLLSPFDRLLGEWRITRTIPGHASIAGSAHVALLAATDALYEERVEVALESGKRVTGTRRYLYRRTQDGMDILFVETQQLFQSLQFLPDGTISSPRRTTIVAWTGMAQGTSCAQLIALSCTTRFMGPEKTTPAQPSSCAPDSALPLTTRIATG